MNKEYEVVIIGGGPAGLSAGLYTSRTRLNSLLLEQGAIGGQLANAEWVENYPGFPDGINGFELTQLLHRQAIKYGLGTLLTEATGIELQGEQKVVKTTEASFIAKVVIIAGGSERTKLTVPGEKEYTGKGVSYCAVCDGAFFQERTVAIVGGGDAAISEALHLIRFASRVIVIHRRHQLRASRILQEKAFAEPRVEFLWDTIVAEIQGEGVVERLQLINVITGEKSTLDVGGVFVCIGFRPNTVFLSGIIPLHETGHILTNDKMETKVPGIFAVGDIRHNSARQAISAAGDGVTAAIYAEKFIR
jgi:thioredoxin reductase (NADPH)